MRPLAVACFALLMMFASASHAEEAEHYDVVAEYIKELGATEDLRAIAQKELNKSNDTMADVIRNSTRVKLQLSTNIRMLQKMHLNKPFETLIPTIVELYEQKIALHDKTIKIAGAFVGGPRSGVDYGAYAARMPEITASLEFIDETLFKSTPLIFALLIDPQPDKGNHMSRLLITKAQRQQLVDMINREFGKKLDQGDQNYTVSSASVLRTYLTKKGYKCMDEL